MKIIKKLLPLTLAAAMVTSVCASAACSTKDDDNGDGGETKTLISITLDESETKTTFVVGDEFTYDGLKINAVYSTGTETVSTTSDGVSIDSSAYNKNETGVYSISVSYTYESVTQSGSYDVSVVPYRNGAHVGFITGFNNSTSLSASKKTVDISDIASKIEVKKPDATGNYDSSEVLPSSAYDVKVYKGKQEISGDQLKAVGRGAYQIWATLKEKDGDFVFEGFALYYVVDEITKIELTSGTTTQERSLKDNMSNSWQFTVTFASGETETVDKSNIWLSIPTINANTTESTGSVTVTYNEPLANGDSQTVTTVVTYTLTGEKAVPDMAILNGNELDELNKEYVTEFTTFEVLAGAKATISDSKSAIVQLPTGIELNGSNRVRVTQAYKPGGATSATTNNAVINFTADRNFEIYVYAQSNSSGDPNRLVMITTENDYVNFDAVDGVKTMLADGVDTASATARAQAVTGVNEETKFQLSFSADVLLFYVLIVFEEV